jgi:hypothetical protein
VDGATSIPRTASSPWMPGNPTRGSPWPAQDQAWTAGGSRSSRPLRRDLRAWRADQVTVPAHDRIRRHDQLQPPQPDPRRRCSTPPRTPGPHTCEPSLSISPPQDLSWLAQHQDLDVLLDPAARQESRR